MSDPDETGVMKMSLPFAKSAALAALVLFMAADGAFSSQILLCNQSSAPGANVLCQVTFASQAGSISGVQFDVQYDNSAISLAAALSDLVKTSGKTLNTADLAPDRKRFLIIGPNRNLIPDGAMLNLSIHISPNAPAGTYALELSNNYGTDPSGNPVLVIGSGGIVTVNAGTSSRLQSNGVLSAGSLLPGPLAPGELITLIGSGIGPSSAQQSIGSPANTSLAGTSVLFDGQAAPLLYAAPNQINAIVPYGVAGKAITQLIVAAQGQTIAAVAQPVVVAAPAIFALDSTGSGQGAILNQDSAVNSPSRPADKGSVIAIFATGAGQTNPPGVDGRITDATLPMPLLPISVQIAGLDAQVSYAGAAPGLVTGVLQVNALIPSNAPSGPAIPISLLVGGVHSQAGITLAIH